MYHDLTFREEQEMMEKRELYERIYSLNKDEPLKFKSVWDALSVLEEYRFMEQEHFIVITLNAAHEIISKRVVNIGTVNQTLVHPREIFRQAILDNATAIIVAHNHPSGNPVPSPMDNDVSRSLGEAGEIIGIRVLDHIIVSSRGHYSYLDQNGGLG